MNRPPVPPWFIRARGIAARMAPPTGAPFAAAKKPEAADLYLYDAIGKDAWLEGGIGAQDVVDALGQVAGAPRLNVHINSPGGQVFDGIAIYNAIRGFDGERVVYVDGIAASIASVIALAGDKVITNEGATWMIHEPMGAVLSFGTADDIEDDAAKTVKALRKVRDNILDIYVNATGRPLSQIAAWMGTETWMTPAEALERGFTDEIVQQAPAGEAAPVAATATVQVAAKVPLTPRATVDLARARVRALSEQFSGASPGAPGQPGTTAAKV